jgi:hypothetical protein
MEKEKQNVKRGALSIGNGDGNPKSGESRAVGLGRMEGAVA